MKLPYLTELSRSRTVTDVFGGYNHNLRIGDGEFYDMNNLTSDYYPLLSPRKKYKKFIADNEVEPVGIYAKGNALVYANYNFKLVYDGIAYDGQSGRPNITLNAYDKTFVSMGAFLLIFPDKIWFNTISKEWGNIENHFANTSRTVSYNFSDEEGNELTVNNTEPGNPADGDYWLDQTVTPSSLKRYSALVGEWDVIDTTYIKIECNGIGGFEANDSVVISGITSSVTDFKNLEGVHTVVSCGTNFIVIKASFQTVHAIDYEIVPIKIDRSIPDMDFIIESENRLWGCKYGNGVNEIYASALGDFKNWNRFEGISTDSYAASVGSDGPFTGAISFQGRPIFFKENFIHKIYGNYPSNFQIQTIVANGVKEGYSPSVSLVDGAIFYYSKVGFVYYDGTSVNEITSQFGDEITKLDSTACSCGFFSKYYVWCSFQDHSEECLIVYDAKRALWNKQYRIVSDDTNYVAITSMASTSSDIFAVTVDYENNYAIVALKGSEGTETEDKVSWYAESGIIAIEYPDQKYLANINIRMSLDFGSSVTVFVQYDSVGEWEQVFAYTSTTLRSFSMPIVPRRCDHLRLKIVGKGDAKIYSVTKTIEKGSDM